jgi:predicted DNA-binding protein
MKDEKDKIRLNFVVSRDVNNTLENLAKKTGGTKSEVFRKAIALMEVMVEAKHQGKTIQIVEKGQPLTTEIIGL